MFETIVMVLIGSGVVGLLVLSLLHTMQNTDIIQNTENILTLLRVGNDRLAIIERATLQTNTVLMADIMGNGNQDGTPKLIGPTNIVSTLEELIQKIVNDPNYLKKNQDEVDKLKNLFETPDEPDDDDFPPEPWQRGGK